jgi:hypothetical protein
MALRGVADKTLGGNTASFNGITFPATQVASADANTLDDYEEGTWTPALRFGGAGVGITYAATEGSYTKKGNEVNATGIVALTSKGSSTGEATISLPFAAGSASGKYSAASFSMSGGGPSTVLQGRLVPEESTIRVIKVVAAVGAYAEDSDFTGTDNLSFSITYRV